MNMICDNCGAEIDKKERYCPNCGMELPGPVSKPSKKKHYRNSQPSTRGIPHPKADYENYYDKADYEKPLKRRHYRDSNDFSSDNFHPQKNYKHYNEEEDYKTKPLKRKYYRDSTYFTSDSPYQDDDYESYYAEEEDYRETKKSGRNLGTILLLLIIVLLFGFIIGLVMFSSNTQSIPQVPGLNS